MSQIESGLKKDQQRLIRLWVTTATTPKGFTHDSDKNLLMSQVDEHTDLTPNQFYLVDPFGNLILSYKNNTPASHILIDLQQLMRLSQIG